MTNRIGVYLEAPLYIAEIRTVTFSGIVRKMMNGVISGVSRTLHFYKDDVLLAEITSASDGTFSVSVRSLANQVFRVICVGVEGEESQIFENVSGA